MTSDARAPAAEMFTTGELRGLVTIERVGGSISLISVLLIFLAYGLVPRVRNVQNTFILFASVSNVGASIASIIAMDGLHQGAASPLCQAQSFLFEMFMQSDPWWSLAMAVNVFLVFFFRTSPDSFQRWWWLYCMICYGGPFVFAISLLLVRDHGRPRVYGSATIWCWVDDTWDEIRIYTYYMLVWICIGGSLILYFAVGYHVFHSRNQFRSFSTSKESRDHTQIDHSQSRLPETPPDGFYGKVVTEVQVVHSKADPHQVLHIEATHPSADHTKNSSSISSDSGGGNIRQSQTDGDPKYPKHHEEMQQQAAVSQFYSSVTAAQKSHRVRRSAEEKAADKAQASRQSILSRIQDHMRAASAKFIVEDPIKRAYLRTNFLFALSVLVTWIPSSMNRIHGWVAGSSPFGYHMASATVLPLQGLWNAIIFFITSWHSLKNWYRGAKDEPWVAGDSISRTVDVENPVERQITRRDDMALDSDGDFNSEREGSEVELRVVSSGVKRFDSVST